MHVKVPDVSRCCFCLPLRPGIILFAYINIIFSVLLVTCLIITTELQRPVVREASVEVMTCTVLFSILGMGVILNFLLLIAGYQKDIAMLRLYNYYAVATTLAALVPSCFLMSKRMFVEAVIAMFVIDYLQSLLVQLSKLDVLGIPANPLIAFNPPVPIFSFLDNRIASTMQCYVIVLVRSEVVKLENKEKMDQNSHIQEHIDISDCVTLV